MVRLIHNQQQVLEVAVVVVVELALVLMTHVPIKLLQMVELVEVVLVC
jgi:hypothetical protein